MQKTIIVRKNKKSRSILGIFASIIFLIVSIIYISNPTAGIFEFIPDNLPVIGNLDEAGASYIIITSLRYLGLDLAPFIKNN